ADRARLRCRWQGPRQRPPPEHQQRVADRHRPVDREPHRHHLPARRVRRHNHRRTRMNALRRDLVERKLWMVVAILVVAIAAVPVFLLKGATASTTPTVPAPAAAPATGGQTTTSAPSSTEPV